MGPPRHSLPIVVLLAAALAHGAAFAVASLPDFRDTPEGRTLPALLEDDPGALRERLQALRTRFEGDADFDLLFARAAIAVGDLDEARLALERVQFLAPDTPGVRSLLLSLRADPTAAPERVAAWRDPAIAAATVDRASLAPLDGLLDERSWEEAWSLARELLGSWEGDPGFDYLYGVAALEAGHPEEAVFALQRVLFFDPEQTRVRAQLARAHFLGGDLDQAEREFQRVLAAGPPAAVAGSIQGYLGEIERIRGARSPSLLARVEFVGGFDDNVNSATADGTVGTPLGTFDLTEDSQARASGFSESRLRLIYERPLSRRRTLDLVFGASLRHNFDEHEFDLDVYRLEAGYAHEEGARRLRGALRGAVVTLDGDSFQRSAGLGLSWGWYPGRWRFDGALDATLVRYPDDGERDVAQLLASATVGFLQPRDLLTMGVFVGSELPLDDDGEFNGRDLAGLSARWEHAALPGRVPFARYRLLATRHHQDHPVFAERREDVQQSAALGWSWLVSEAFSARAEMNYTETRSSLDLFDYDRFRVETGLSFRF
jgi:tetratricopeptide (TPR) repeat protein